MYLHNIIVLFGAAIWRHTSTYGDGKMAKDNDLRPSFEACKLKKCGPYGKAWRRSTAIQGSVAAHALLTSGYLMYLGSSAKPKISYRYGASKKFLDAVAANKSDRITPGTLDNQFCKQSNKRQHGGISAKAPQGVAERTRNCRATAVQEAKTPCSARRTKPQR